MNIIIPVCGIGKRFQDDGYTTPKPLIRSLGKPIIFWNLENLKTDDNDTIYIVYRDEFKKFNFEDLILSNNKDKPIKFIPTSYDTRGSSETVLLALNSMDDQSLSDLTIVIDSDNFYIDDIVKISKEKKSNLIFYSEEYSINPLFSYIQIDPIGNVLKIKEKEKISDNACVGAYCFSDGFLLKNTIEEVIIKGEKEKGEFYISSLYNHLLKSNIKVKSKKIENYICLGTPNQLKSFSSNFSVNNEKYRFCFDLDNTLVSYPKVKDDYSTVEPIKKTINFCNFLKDQGHTIIIYTARRMRTNGGNVGKVISEISQVTLNTLSEFNIKYDELYFGKPYAHFYIDDLAVKSYDDLEKETGFYDIHPKTRSHNKIEIFDNFIIKYSDYIGGERFFYQNINKKIKNYFPELIEYGDNFIKISRINGVPISFLNVSKILTDDILNKILYTVREINNSQVCNNNINIYSNYSDKFNLRVNNFDYESFKNSKKIINEISMFLEFYEKNNLGICGLIHGDPVFTNILIDNFDNLKFIDMRGKIGDNYSVFGDIFYDYSKIYQSIIGYDFILMDKELDHNYIDGNKTIFKKFICDNYGDKYFDYVRNITKSLILTLIPIHNDDKCDKYFNLINTI